MLEIKEKKVIRSVFTVKDKIYLTPNYIRVNFQLRDEHIDLLKDIKIGSVNKIFIPKKGMNVIYFPDKRKSIEKELLSIVRTYTTRKIDLEKRELSIDFVVHGENAPASSWAQETKTGDTIGIAMKESNKPLFPEADRYLLIGDATALPVISTIIEQLPKGVKADAIIEVSRQYDEVSLYSLANVNIKWIFNPHPEQGSKLAELAKIIKHPEPKISRFAFLAGEYDTIKRLRAFFKNEKGWNSNEIYSCAYWKSGESENQSSTTRKTESDENKD